MLTSSSSGVRFKNGANVDTFCLYGGPGTADGKFDDGTGAIPDVLGRARYNIIPGEWYGVDLTDQEVFWQISTFCAETLDGDGSSGGLGDGPGNRAWWAGTPEETVTYLKELEEKYPGLEQIMIAFPMGSTKAQFREQLTRFAKEVMPAFREQRVNA